jgi:6,7-dimethyl-8-ribityllumazine synthase
MAQDKPITEIEPRYAGTGLRIGVVRSRFNPEVSEGLLSACMSALAKHAVDASDIRVVTVPGALELPVALLKMATSGRFDALIALGAVIRGETYHFEIVSNDACRGVMRVQLETGVPIANGILTTDTDDQALVRMAEKGADCALAAIEMANLMKRLDG